MSQNTAATLLDIDLALDETPAKAESSTVLPQKMKIEWVQSIPYIAVHALAIAGLFYFDFAWKWAALCVGSYYLRMWGITMGYHRYFSHRSYKTGRIFQFIIGWIGTMATQKGVLWWAVNHRSHHRNSDMPEDSHSPVQGGFWHSHTRWVITNWESRVSLDNIRDFTKFPELVWLNKYHLVPVVAYGVLLYALGGWPAFYWGWVLSTVLLWHGTYTVNSVAHIWGKKRYKTGDESRNNWLVALITMGEGWHNNHHYYMSSARQGFFWWEIDASYMILKVLEKAGIVWDVRTPSDEVRNANRLA